MMCSIVLYNHVENEKNLLESFWRKLKNTIPHHLIPYHNPRLRVLQKNHRVSFEILLAECVPMTATSIMYLHFLKRQRFAKPLD